MARLPLIALLLSVLVLQASPALAEAGAGWDNGFYIESEDGRFRVRVTGRAQARFTFESEAAEGNEERQTRASFNIPRARIGLEGHLLTKRLRYAIIVNLGKGFVSAHKVYVDYTLVDDWLQVRAGQFVRPFSRQQINSDSRQGLLDRAITDAAFGAGRDIGVMLHNGRKQEFEWAVTLMNGTGVNSSSALTVSSLDGGVLISSDKPRNYPDLFNPMVVTRLAYNQEGVNGYDEVDHKGGGFRFAVGGGAMVNFGLPEETVGSITANVDAIVKVEHFSATAALYLATRQDGEAFSTQVVDKLGLHLLAGYLIKSKVFPALRYARLQGMDEEGEVVQEITGALSVLIDGHRIKWAVEFTALGGQDFAPEATDFRVRTQLQVDF